MTATILPISTVAAASRNAVRLFSAALPAPAVNTPPPHATKWPLVGLRSNPGAATYTEAVQLLCLLPHAALVRGSVTAWVSPERLILPQFAALTR